MTRTPEAVVLVHGLWMRGPDMALLRWRLRRRGYVTYQFSYSTRGCTLDDAAQRLHPVVAALDEPIVHFVAHSLGGLVVQRYFEQVAPMRPGRVVTLGTPHQGSVAARQFAKTAWGRFFLGRCFETGLARAHPAWTAANALGVMAGSVSFGVGRFIAADLPRPNDGAVAVSETHVDGAAAHCVVRTSHAGLLVSAQAARRICLFLQSGTFDAGASAVR